MLTGNLEYIISSLPNLRFSDLDVLQQEVTSVFQSYASEDAAVNLITILDTEASKYLSNKKFQLFQNIQLNTIHQSKFQRSKVQVVAEFAQFMFLLKNELKSYRLARKNKDTSDNNKTHYEFITELPQNPLEAEQELMQLQWQKLNALSIGHYADFSALILYKLKLQILLRRWSFDRVKGFELFQQTLKTA